MSAVADDDEATSDGRQRVFLEVVAADRPLNYYDHDGNRYYTERTVQQELFFRTLQLVDWSKPVEQRGEPLPAADTCSDDGAAVETTTPTTSVGRSAEEIQAKNEETCRVLRSDVLPQLVTARLEIERLLDLFTQLHSKNMEPIVREIELPPEPVPALPPASAAAVAIGGTLPVDLPAPLLRRLEVAHAEKYAAWTRARQRVADKLASITTLLSRRRRRYQDLQWLSTEWKIEDRKSPSEESSLIIDYYATAAAAAASSSSASASSPAASSPATAAGDDSTSGGQSTFEALLETSTASGQDGHLCITLPRQVVDQHLVVGFDGRDSTTPSFPYQFARDSNPSTALYATGTSQITDLLMHAQRSQRELELFRELHREAVASRSSWFVKEQQLEWTAAEDSLVCLRMHTSPPRSSSPEPAGGFCFAPNAVVLLLKLLAHSRHKADLLSRGRKIQLPSLLGEARRIADHLCNRQRVETMLTKLAAQTRQILDLRWRWVNSSLLTHSGVEVRHGIFRVRILSGLIDGSRLSWCHAGAVDSFAQFCYVLLSALAAALVSELVQQMKAFQLPDFHQPSQLQINLRADAAIRAHVDAENACIHLAFHRNRHVDLLAPHERDAAVLAWQQLVPPGNTTLRYLQRALLAIDRALVVGQSATSA